MREKVNNPNQIRVNIENGLANVTTAEGRFHVAPRGGTSAVASCPMCLMLGALGSCIMLTLNAVAVHKEIDLGNSWISLDYIKEDDSKTRFLVDVTLDPRLTDREQKILFRSARLCDVGKILKSDVQIDYSLLDQDHSPVSLKTVQAG
mgnify:CR=1 FL=1